MWFSGCKGVSESRLYTKVYKSGTLLKSTWIPRCNMATLTKVCHKSGDAYKAVIRLRGSKTFSKTFKLRKPAKAWADHIEQDVEASRACGTMHMLAP